MNRRHFLATVLGIAAAAVTLRPKETVAPVKGLPYYIWPKSEPYGPSQSVIFAQNGINQNSIMSRVLTADPLPTDLAAGDLVYWREGRIWRMTPRGLPHNDLD